MKGMNVMGKNIVILSILLFFGALSASQAAIIEFDGLPDAISPNMPGDIQFGVYLSDMGNLPNVDAFNLILGISGAPNLEMHADIAGTLDSNDYIFYRNSFALTADSLGGDLSQLGLMDVTSSGIGNNQADRSLLGRITLSHPELDPGTKLTLSLLPDQSFVLSDIDSGSLREDLIGSATTIVTPIPGAVWLFGTGIMAFFSLKQWRHR
jgi:hypothetical protein